MPGVVYDPTPAPRGTVRPATEEGTPNPAAPWYLYYPGFLSPKTHLFGSPSWPVWSYKTTDQNGNPVVVNVTQPGHPFYPGVVMRYLTMSPSGPTIQNEGAGLAPRQLLVPDWITDHVWRDQSQNIMTGVRRHWPRAIGKPLGW